MGDKRDHKFYILGAGFSADAGVPVVRDFLQVVREYADAPENSVPDHLQDDYDAVLKCRRKIRPARDSVYLDLENIEVLFSLLETDRLLGVGLQKDWTPPLQKHSPLLPVGVTIPTWPSSRSSVQPSARA
jgi:hypothetical protein